MDNFFIHFVLCNITIGLFVLILLCMKRIFKHCLTPRMQFNLWIPFTISLLVPFLPVSFSTLSTKMQDLFHPLAHFSHTVHTTNTSEYTSSSTNQIYEYTVSSLYFYHFLCDLGNRHVRYAILFCAFPCITAPYAPHSKPYAGQTHTRHLYDMSFRITASQIHPTVFFIHNRHTCLHRNSTCHYTASPTLKNKKSDIYYCTSLCTVIIKMPFSITV